jgi:hypothetical protein
MAAVGRPGIASARPPGIGLNRSYTLGPLVGGRVPTAYQLGRDDPHYRRLRIFASDPSMSRLEGNIVVADVPYEPLEEGRPPTGKLFEVRCEDAQPGTVWCHADLEDHAIVMRHGYEPSQSEPRFHQQMVYAVASLVHRSFRRALGRQLGWGGAAATTGRLTIYPVGLAEDNAYYDAEAGELRFGYFKAKSPKGRTLADSYVFTALSHDVISHELTHALIDGLRAQFLTPSGPDVAAFHEGFSDVVALFHHFGFRDALRNAIRQGRGDLASGKAAYLFEIAQQFGRSGGDDQPLRNATSARRYDRRLESHDLGEVLLATIYDAFRTVFRRKTGRIVQLATGGSGVLAEGELHPLLVDVLTEKAGRLAEQFLAIVIRAIDYCPPVDLHLGEFLQAIITADRELVPDDTWAYREAFIDAFRERGVFLRNVDSLSEDALVWRPPQAPIPTIAKLAFAELRFAGDPGWPADPREVARQACALGDVATDPRYRSEFGLVASDDQRLGQARVDLPRIESIRSVRRAGPDGRVVFDLVAEITQQCTVPRAKGKPGFSYWGGATVIIDPRGDVRYIILKNVVGQARLERRREFLEDPRAAQFWNVVDNEYRLKGNVARLLHIRPGRR